MCREGSHCGRNPDSPSAQVSLPSCSVIGSALPWLPLRPLSTLIGAPSCAQSPILRTTDPAAVQHADRRAASACGCLVAGARIVGRMAEVEPIPLEPVDALTVTTLVDNVTDILLGDEGPARRPPIGSGPRVPASVLDRWRGIRRAARRARVRGARDGEPGGASASRVVRYRDLAGRPGREHAAPGALAPRCGCDRPQPRPLRPCRWHGGAGAGAAPGQPAGRDPSRGVEPATSRAAGTGSGSDRVAQPWRARGCRL